METEKKPFSDNKDIINVVEFCINLFKFQSETPRSAPSEVLPVEHKTGRLDYIYELHVYVESEKKWTSRRMSISTLGEGSGSKSKCFKVIYDTLMVVKIPPSPIENFDEYIRSISAEARVAVQLTPKIEFVAPGVSAILKKIHTFPDEAELSLHELEQRYVEWLKEYPEFQEYLKIENAFVFFMDLSKYSFLSYVVEKMYDKTLFKDIFHEEIVTSQTLLWDILGFEGKYGSENLSVCFDMNRVYSDYEAKLRSVIKKYAGYVASSYEKQKWFSMYVSEKEVREGESNVPPGFVPDLNELLKTVLEENKKYIGAYKKAIWKYIRKTVFFRYKPKISGIVTNIIDLLASLKERGVSIRDLKPDNLFVVGDPNLSAEECSLGLIDFETSVKFKPDKPGEAIEQPVLAGTPSYCTPSHLFKNDLLKSLFGNLPRNLYLQDWHAAVAMIYYVVTGYPLFEHTKKVLSKISAAARNALKKKHPMTGVFKKGSQIFWSRAVAEFYEKLNEHEDIIRSVEVFIPENTQEIFLQEIVAEKNNTADAMQHYVMSQSVFSSEKNRKNLIESCLGDIRQYRQKWEKKENFPETAPKVREKVIRVLRELEAFKQEAELQEQWMDLLTQSSPKLSAYDLLELMFHIVLRAMYRREWGTLPDEIISRSTGRTCEKDSLGAEDITV